MTFHSNEFLQPVGGSTDPVEDSDGDEGDSEGDDSEGPAVIADDDLAIELVLEGLDNPTTMAFSDSDEILVLKKIREQ